VSPIDVIQAAARMAAMTSREERHAALLSVPEHLRPLAKELALSHMRVVAHWQALLARDPLMLPLAPEWFLAQYPRAGDPRPA
jgi:hypothetical protein